MPFSRVAMPGAALLMASRSPAFAAVGEVAGLQAAAAYGKRSKPFRERKTSLSSRARNSFLFNTTAKTSTDSPERVSCLESVTTFRSRTKLCVCEAQGPNTQPRDVGLL
jgi:hypothetical protein